MKDQKRISAVQIEVDTNVFIDAIGKISSCRWLWGKIVSGEFSLCSVKIFAMNIGRCRKNKLLQKLQINIDNFLVTIHSVKFIQPFISWNFITGDADDNKFADYAINSGTKCTFQYLEENSISFS